MVDVGIGQAGSLADFDRLRVDFHFPKAVSAAQLSEIETLINGWISEAHSLEVQEMAIEQAKAAGAAVLPYSRSRCGCEAAGGSLQGPACGDRGPGAGMQGAAQSLVDQLGESAAVVIGGLPNPADQGKVILVAAVRTWRRLGDVMVRRFQQPTTARRGASSAATSEDGRPDARS